MVEKRPLISKIQRYSTKDGPGIRTTVFFLGCNLNCKWCSNPELMTPESKILHYQTKCEKCGYCVTKSQGTISLNEEGIIIDRLNCKNLKKIASICPYEAYECIGEYYQPDYLVDRLLRDEVFYIQSKGGVTFSGGEAGLYPEYLIEICKKLKKNNIHTCMDTAGLWDYDDLIDLFELIDLFLFDIKTYDSSLHKELCGVDNKLILENIKKLCLKGKEVIARLILVPSLNSDLKDLKNRLDYLAKIGIKQVDILFYHRLGVGKYKALGKDYEYLK